MVISTKVRRLAVLTLALQLTISMVNFALIYFLKDKGLSSFEIGFASSINPFFYFLSCLFLPLVLKRVSLKPRVIFGLVLMALSLAFILLSPNKYLIFLALVLNGFSMAFLWPNIEAMITQNLDKRELGRALGLFNFSWSFGAGISTLIGGITASMNYSLPLAIAIVTLLALSVFSFSIKEHKGEIKEAEVLKRDVDRASEALVYFSFLGVFFIYAGYSLIITIFPLYAMESLNMNEKVTGALLLCRGLTTCLTFVLLSFYDKERFTIRANIMPQVILIILLSAMEIAKSRWAFAVIFVIYGFIFALTYDVSIYNGARNSEKRERNLSLHEIFLTAGTLIGSLVGGFIYNYYSFEAILKLMRIVCIIVLVVELPLMVKLGCFDRAKGAFSGGKEAK